MKHWCDVYARHGVSKASLKELDTLRGQESSVATIQGRLSRAHGRYRTHLRRSRHEKRATKLAYRAGLKIKHTYKYTNTFEFSFEKFVPLAGRRE